MGMTGSGKTTLARRLLSARPYVIVIDTKHELTWPGFKRTSTLDVAFGNTHSIFRPERYGDIPALFERVYKEGAWNVYVDEVYGIGGSNHTSYPAAYIKCLTRGRSRKLTVWTGTQRPRFLPLFAFTESTHFFVFRLGSNDDRKHVARMAGVDGLDVPLSGHEFLYYNRTDDHVVKSILRAEDL